MTEIEAIKELKEAIDCCTSGEEEYFKESLGMGILAIEEIQQYRAIGTIEEFKALKEKNEPKKPIHNGANWYRCNNGCEVHKKAFEKDWYCPKCGQKLDWSE